MGVSPLFADDITLRTSIYSSSDGGNIPATQHIPYVPTGIKRVHLKTNIETDAGLKLAMKYAEDLFSQQMAEMYIDLVTINAYVRFGEIGNFEDDELCQVEVKYTDTLGYNPKYMNIGQTFGVSLPRILPRALSNQSRGISNDTCMIIWLNPSIPLYCDTAALPDNSQLYDATTILMRALAIGCGIQSSYDPYRIPHYGILYNDELYLSAFDTRIHNNVVTGYSYFRIEDVVTEEITDTFFLEEHKIYADGYGSSVQLYNDWENGFSSYIPLTSFTYNTIDFENYTMEERLNGYNDLLETTLQPGREIREISSYTKELLRGLGWLYTDAVGFNNPYDYFYNCSLSCSGTILNPQTSYTAQINSNNVNMDNLRCELNTQDGSCLVGRVNNNEHTFIFDTLPRNVQWERDIMTKNIVGHMKATAWILGNNGIMQQEKTCDIQIPYRPNSPIVSKTESTNNDAIQLNLSAFADGSDTYTITYTGANDLTSHTFTVSAYALDTVINSIPSTQMYSMTIYGTNTKGNSDTCRFSFGQSANPPLYMTTSLIGSTLTYDFSRGGTIDISWVTVSSVQITNTMGITVLNPGLVQPGNPINISSLPRGYYLLWVVANGRTYSKRFGKSY